MIDLAEEWRKLDAVRHKPDAQEHWDKRARTFSFHDAPNDYVSSFIRKMQLQGGESILDMGCGTGSLAVPLARAGHAVVAADFSQGMLERVRENAAGLLVEGAQASSGLGGLGSGLASALGGTAAEAVSTLSRRSAVLLSGHVDRDESPARCRMAQLSPGKVLPLQMSWESNWEEHGLPTNSVDVAIASRSIITHDLEDSITKLSAVAKKRVCVTAGTGVSPRVDERVARAMGLQLERHNDALFVFGIASALGFEPTVSYIRSPRTKTYSSPEEAYHSLMKTLDYVDDHASQVSTEVAAARLREWLQQHLVQASAEGGGELWALDAPRVVPWAFISWET